MADVLLACSQKTMQQYNGSIARTTQIKEVEFELSAEQHELLGPITLQQGHPLELTLETSVLLPELDAESWFHVQPEALSTQFVRISEGTYAFSGQIQEAEIIKEQDQEMAFLLVNCDDVLLRAICGPGGDGRLPWGTWETRYLTGISRLHGILEDDFATGIGETVGATVWSINRLVLTPGDPHFGEWHQTSELPVTPYRHDKIFVTTRLHRKGI